MLDLIKLEKQFDEILKETDFQQWLEDYETRYPSPSKGWVSFEKFLPQISAESWVEKGYEEFLVKDIENKEFTIPITADSLSWYRMDVAHLNLTHWFNK